MRGSFLIALAAAALCAPVSAHADARSYCEAYARDAATSRLSGQSILTGVRAPVAPAAWQGAYDAALADCLATYAIKPKVADARPLKRMVKAAPVVADDSLQPGSADWVAYCSKKYTSFDVKTGLYTGMSGKQRPCLVTKN